VDVASRELTDGDLRALLRQRQAAGNTGALAMVLSADGVEQSVSFSVLGHAEERAVDAEQAAFASAPGLLPRLGRAHVLLRHRLYHDAASEYEAALALAPESRVLLCKTFEAQRLTGNLARAGELRRRLEGRPATP
jgi:hypothetical protein